ncbi:IucA/IucC family siderophore biosynthesis protein [Salibacterium salarium]|uniref:IucA/IucC family siderophore biosynthesis protein n=1 Tax=Salibacterium salarium TaxID=284579 RepID=A0A428MUB4_9BACI|nr:IucA/IucC family siderophore biosynthesis protein [Salibacterium salarium]RSL29721.1 IucA/IucC family siderophore biosynthesis protein [Salibacterium salarium]
MLFTKEIQNVINYENWKKVNQKLLAKMLSEYMYEDMIHPTVLSKIGVQGEYEFEVSENKKYCYVAEERFFDSFDVKWRSIEIVESGERRNVDSAIELLVDIKPLIGMSAETISHLIKEMNATLIADAHLLEKDSKTSEDLVNADYALLEGFMDGHPWITYNKGRIGFGYDDYLAYAPEQQKEIRLSWIAVHQNKASFQSVSHLNYHDLLAGELSEQERTYFLGEIKKNGKDPSDYYLLPVHEWQWKNILIQNFPEEIAKKQLIPLGDGEDGYLPQQSIRTFVNQSSQKKHHVKLPMSILNTLVYRGLPAERTLVAPKVTEWIKGICENDSFLKEECRVILPGENASINVDQRFYKGIENIPYQYLEMLGAIWRESIYTYVEEGEQAITLAALLHEDHNDHPFVMSLIEASALEPEEWIRQFFKVIMDPLLHYLYQYGTVFSPHGQNTILVLKDAKPHRLAIKDFVDDVNVTDQDFPELKGITSELKHVLRTESPEGLTQFIFTGLFICHLRYLSNIFVNHQLIDEETFWSLLANSIIDYQNRFPHLDERFKLFDLFQPKLTKLCLNRNRMVDYGYSEENDRPHASEFGKVSNALARFEKSNLV